MKRNIIFVLAALPLLSVACVKEEPQSPEMTGLVEKTFTAGSQAPTKTAIDEGLNIIWSAEDKIAVYASGATTPQAFGIKSLGNGGKTAEFSGMTEEASEYLSIYPYNEDFSVSESLKEAVVTIPTVQTAVEDSFDPKANVSLSRTTGTNLFFRNVASLLKLTVGNDGIKSIVITAKDASDVLSGQASIDFSGDIPTVKSVTAGSASVELTGDFLKGKSYFFVLYPGKFNSGLSLKMTNSEGLSVTLTNPAALESSRNEMIDLGTITVPAEKWIQSYVLNGKAEVEAFVNGKGNKKETVNNLTITGSDVDDESLRSIVERVGTVRGQLTLDGVGVDGKWINTENFIENMECKGSFVFKNIAADVNANVFLKEKFKIIHGDLIFENCPKAHIGNGGWMPFKNIEKIEGSLRLKNVSGLNGETIASLQYVGGDFYLSSIGGFWHLGGKTADLTYIGGDLVIENCGGFGEDGKYRFYGLHSLTHIGGNVILNGISPYMTTNETDLANKKASLCILRDYAESGVIGPDASVFIKKGEKELPFDSLTSCDPNAHRSYVLNGHAAVRAFVDAAGSEKETVRNLTVSGSDVTENDIRDIDNRVNRIVGTLTLENLGTDAQDSWISTDEVMEYISIEGSIVLKNIAANVNPNGFEKLTKINGDLKVINCPRLRCSGGWMPFKSVTEVTGDVFISGQEEFSRDFLNKLEKVGGSFTIEKCKSCRNWKSETLREIGGDLNITDCVYWENFYGFHQLSKLGGNVNVYKSEGYAQDSNGNDKWLPGTDWDLNGKRVGLVLFTVLNKKGIFTGKFSSYLWRASDKGGTFWYDVLKWEDYLKKADEIIASN